MCQTKPWSASFDRRAEDIGVFAIVISELKFCDVKMQIFSADLVKSSNIAAFQDRPEAFDGLRMDRTVNVLMRAVVNSLMGITVFSESLVSGPLIGAKQADLV